jgi:hypothetical protein
MYVLFSCSHACLLLAQPAAPQASASSSLHEALACWWAGWWLGAVIMSTPLYIYIVFVFKEITLTKYIFKNINICDT